MLAGPGTMIGDYDILMSPYQHQNSFVCQTTHGQVLAISKEEYINLQIINVDAFKVLCQEAKL
jgi:hypothetical protein